MNKLIIKGFMVLGIGTVFSGCIDNVVAPEPTTYTKLDTQGLALTDQTVGWSEDASASEANYNRWSCVQDDTSTLIWEIKTSYAGNALQAANDMFTWYNTDAASNGGEAGIGDLGNNVATSYENGPYTALEPATQIGSDYCYDSGRCDTKKYIEDINAFGLCGLSDWRMPTQDELANLIYGTYKSNGGGVYSSLPAGTANIHPDYFPYFEQVTTNDSWLSSTTHELEANLAGAVSFRFYSRDWVGKASRYHIMLVHD